MNKSAAVESVVIEQPRDVQSVSVSAPAGGRGRLKLALAAVAVLAGVAVGVRAYLHSLAYEGTDDAFVEGHVVQVSPKVSAHAVKVDIDDNFEVKAGQRLVDLDPRDFEVARAQADASLAAARGRVSQAGAQQGVARAAASQARADVDGAVASMENARADLARNRDLQRQRVIGQRELDNAVERDKGAAAALESARQKAAGADAQITLADAQVTAAKAEVTQGEAQVRQAALNLSYCAIDAPTSGRVTRKNIEPGAYVQPGQALLAVVQHDVWVVANYKETQLAHMRVGQAVEVRADALPGQRLRGHVESIQSGTGARFSLLPPENATGNYVKVIQRVPVKIVLDEPPAVLARLAPGMSVEPEVQVR